MSACNWNCKRKHTKYEIKSRRTLPFKEKEVLDLIKYSASRCLKHAEW